MAIKENLDASPAAQEHFGEEAEMLGEEALVVKEM
jgi:hypothetical protein